MYMCMRKDINVKNNNIYNIDKYIYICVKSVYDMFICNCNGALSVGFLYQVFPISEVRFGSLPVFWGNLAPPRRDGTSHDGGNPRGNWEERCSVSLCCPTPVASPGEAAAFKATGSKQLTLYGTTIGIGILGLVILVILKILTGSRAEKPRALVILGISNAH